MDERDYKALNKNLNALKKEDIYVAVSGKKQAKQFKAILLALGEDVREDYWSDYSIDPLTQTFLICHQGLWTVSRQSVRTKITIKELIKLLADTTEVKPKLVLTTEDGIELFEGYKCVIVDIKNNSICNYYFKIESDFINLSEHRYFLTIRAANDWIEKQKNTLTELTLGGAYKACINPSKTSVNIFHKSDTVATLTKSDIGTIFNELNK